MNHGTFRRGAPRVWGMGACPHVSEATLTPIENGGTAQALFAGAMCAHKWSPSRHEKQTAVQQVVA